MKKTSALIAAALLAACGGSKSDPPARTATPVLTVSGTIANASQLDSYPFTVPAPAATVHFRTFDEGGVACDPAHGGVDTTVEVLDAASATVWYEDDSTAVPSARPFCEDFSLALDGGAYTVVVGGWDPTPFNYVLKVELP